MQLEATLHGTIVKTAVIDTPCPSTVRRDLGSERQAALIDVEPSCSVPGVGARSSLIETRPPQNRRLRAGFDQAVPRVVVRSRSFTPTTLEIKAVTTHMIDFQELTEKSMDGDWLREMTSFAAQRLMGLKVDGLCSAGFGECWEVHAGVVDQKNPKLRKGTTSLKHAASLRQSCTTYRWRIVTS